MALGTNKSASFSIQGNPKWMWITNEGVLTGTPDVNAPPSVEVIVTATWNNETLPPRTYVVPVLPSACRADVRRAFAWCDTPDPAVRPDQGERWGFTPEQTTKPGVDGKVRLDCENYAGCIVQFHRLRTAETKKPETAVGEYGYFDAGSHAIAWGPPDGGGMEDSIVKAINGSKVLISGSVLIKKNVPHCAFWSWSVVTQTVDSSNNLFYGASEVAVFCVDDPRSEKPELKTVLIALPVHAIWANAYALPANTNDLTWKPISAPPAGHECWTGKTSAGLPLLGIRPCDADKNDAPTGDEDEKSNWLLRRYYSVGSLYNRLTQPGVSQGSISISPIMPATKTTWDVQAYESTLAGPGWAGFQLMYERDRKAVDDFDSLTAAFTYDLRVAKRTPYWLCLNADGFLTRENCDPDGKGSVPPIFGIRPLEISLRAGPEWAPGSEQVKGSFLPTAADAKPSGKEIDYVPRDLNFVGGLMFRSPIIINPVRQNNVKQPEQIALAPVAGLEGGFRAISHDIGTLCPSQLPGQYATATGNTAATGTLCVAPPHYIFRVVVGVDASARVPYNFTRSFLGDRPLTVDFSYRMRRLYSAEPVFDVSRNPFAFTTPEGVAAGGRPYTRITFIAPFSAYLQARATWQRGALPPLFQYVGSEVALGLTFSNPGSSEH